MKQKDFNIGQLATSVLWWLSYTSAVGRNYVLSEGAIKFPVSEYLERSNIDYIELEFPHPVLSMKRFDVYFRHKTTEEIAFEFKYIKNGSTRNQSEKQRVFDDLMRLYLFLSINKKGYFLICGNQQEFVSNFESLLLQPRNTNAGQYIQPVSRSSTPVVSQPIGFYSEWFSFDTSNPLKNINLNIQNNHSGIYAQFAREYNNSHMTNTNNPLNMPATITTNLVYISEDANHQNNILQPSKIGIWEVIV